MLKIIRYVIQITGNMLKFQVETRQFVREEILTKPRPVFGLMVDNVTTEACTISWQVEDGQSCLRGFVIEVKYIAIDVQNQ